MPPHEGKDGDDDGDDATTTEMEELVSYIDELEVQLESANGTISELNETLINQKEIIAGLESQLSKSRPSSATRMIPDNSTYVKELEDMIELVEAERAEGETKLQAALTECEDLRAELAESKASAESLSSALEASKLSNSSLSFQLSQQLSLAPPSVSGSSLHAPTSSLSASSSASSLSGLPPSSPPPSLLAPTPALPLPLSSPAPSASSELTPRSERETEDMLAHLSAANKVLRDDVVEIKERWKRERQRRKQEAEKHEAAVELERKRTEGVELADTKRRSELESSLTRTQASVKDLERLVKELRDENNAMKEAQINRTRDVVERAVSSVHVAEPPDVGAARRSSSNNNTVDAVEEGRGRFSRGDAWNSSGGGGSSSRRGADDPRKDGAENASREPKDPPPPTRRWSGSGHDRTPADDKQLRGPGGAAPSRRGLDNPLPPPYRGDGEPVNGFNPPVGFTGFRRGSKGKVNPEDESAVEVEEVGNWSSRKESRASQGSKTSGYIQTASQRHTSANQQLEDFWLPKAQQKSSMMQKSQGAKIGLGDDDDVLDL